MAYSSTSRWSSSTASTHVFDHDGTSLPTAIRANITQEQLEIYVLHLRTIEVTNLLRLPDSYLVEHSQTKRLGGRASSPAPEYDAAGRRTNTRLQSRRRALEAERHTCIEAILAKMPTYRTPSDYRRPTRFTDRLFIPATDFPSVNFIGQILGPRGQSLKQLQQTSGATIALRGRGSAKQGRAVTRTRSPREDSDSNQPLHAVITADSKTKVEEAKRLLQQVIDNAIYSPEEENSHKTKQLRDLAIMNGTFRDDESRLSHIQLSNRGAAETCNAHITFADNEQLSSANDQFEQEYKMLMQDIQMN